MKNSDPASNRRRFLKTSTATAALVTVPHLAHAAKANEKIVMGIIGPGGMGMNHVRGFADADNVEVAYVCDVDEKRLASAAKEVARRGRAPKAVKDMRTIFEDKNVDAVAIATPDHWHTPASILA